jgi:hypothetical protein
VEILDRAPEVVLCHARTARIDTAGAIIGDYHWEMALDDRRPHRRFADLILVRHNCVIVFGVIRREVLARTPLIGSYVGSDRVLIAELALHGELREVPEELFLRRSHEDNSVRLDEHSDRLAWFDPRLSGHISFPNWRIAREHAASIGRASLGLVERLRCQREVLRHLWQRRHPLRIDLREAFKIFLGRSRPGRWLLALIRRIIHSRPVLRLRGRELHE